MNHQVRDLGRPELWYFPWHPVAFALAGQRAAALGMLERSLAVNKLASWWWFQLDSEPAFEPLRSDRRFAEVRRRVREHVDEQRRTRAPAQRRPRARTPRHVEGSLAMGMRSAPRRPERIRCTHRAEPVSCRQEC